MKFIITSAFLFTSAVAQSVPFFTLSPRKSPVATPLGTPTTAPTDSSFGPTMTVPPTTVEPVAPVPVTSAPTVAPVSKAPTTSKPTKLPTSKAPTTKAPVASLLPSVSIMPSVAPSDRPSDAPTAFDFVQETSCALNDQCNFLNLTGECCPTSEKMTLRCCGEPDVPYYQSCSNNTKCSAFGLEDACCPTADGKYLDCCSALPDECKEPGSCPLYSAAQFKLDLAAAQKTRSNAVTTIVSSMASAVLIVLVAVVAL